MMREDLVGALKNALERGTPLEKAIQSFVTAGYREADVREAAQQLQASGLVAASQVQKPVQKPAIAPVQAKQGILPQTIPQLPKPPQSQQMQQTVSAVYAPRQPTQSPYTMQVPTNPQYQYTPYPTKKSSPTPWVTITLIIVLILLLGLFAASLIYQEQITDFFRQMLGA